MPEAADTQGWGDPIWQTNFNETGAPDPGWWNRYDGEGHNGNGTRDPERINVSGGICTITGQAGGSSGGMSHELGQRYGRWEVRMRAYATGSSGSKYHPVLIVWPDSDNWPEDGEYDFYEGNIGDTSAGAWIHYPHDPGPVQQRGPHSKAVAGGIAEWHNYAIDWQPDGITGYIDGEYWYGPLSGGGNSTREDIQDMPSGHLTIQLDAFHGDSGYQPAKMEIDWVKIYDNESEGSGDQTISSVGPAEVSGFVGLPVVGNRFRMYFTNTAADISPDFHTSWEQTTGAVRKKLDLTRAGSNTAVTIAETSTNNSFDVALGQWVSPPATSAGVLKGGYSYTVAQSESDAAADLKKAFVLKVVSSDGSVVRGVYFSGSGQAEMLTLLQGNQTIGSAQPDIVVNKDDRLVVELGYKATNATATSYSSTLRYGGTAGDLESGDQANATSYAGHITFSDPAVQRLFFGQTVSAVSVGTGQAFGTAAVTQPPALDIGPSGITSAQAVSTPVVTAEAYVISLDSFGGEEFGTLSVVQAVVLSEGIASAEAVPNPTRVLRTGDVFPEGIASAEAHGATALLYLQDVAPLGIESAEDIGGTDVENPSRVLVPFGIASAAAFGTATLAARLRTVSIEAPEAFTKRRAVVRRGRWRLVQPTRVERHRIGGPFNVLYITNVVGKTVYGDDSGLRTVENPQADDLSGAQYVWQGGRDNITESQAIRDLWVANGYDVEMTF